MDSVDGFFDCVCVHYCSLCSPSANVSIQGQVPHFYPEALCASCFPGHKDYRCLEVPSVDSAASQGLLAWLSNALTGLSPPVLRNITHLHVQLN